MNGQKSLIHKYSQLFEVSACSILPKPSYNSLFLTMGINQIKIIYYDCNLAYILFANIKYL